MKQFLYDLVDLQLLPFYAKKFNQISFSFSLIGSYLLCTIFIIIFDKEKVVGNFLGLPTFWFYVSGGIIALGLLCAIQIRQVLVRYWTIDQVKLVTKRLNKEEKVLYQEALRELKNKSTEKRDIQ